MNQINNEYPLIKFPGKIAVITSRESEDEALKELSTESLVGFDTETRPSFKRGEFHHVALIQISTNTKAFLFRINQYGLSSAMTGFLEDDRVTKLGVAVRDDLGALRKIRDFEPGSFVDLSSKAQTLGILKTGLRNLSKLLLASRISKNQQTSNWERDQLTDSQMVYAATDAWICLKLQKKLTHFPPT